MYYIVIVTKKTLSQQNVISDYVLVYDSSTNVAVATLPLNTERCFQGIITIL